MSASNKKTNPFEGKTPEETLLLHMGHEVMNFRPGFPKNKFSRTFVLSLYGSAMFGLMPKDDLVYLGIPKRFYELFSEAKWLYVAKVKSQPGLFLVMQVGKGEKSTSIAIRIFVRSRRLESMTSKIKSIRAVPMNRSGITREDDLLKGFTLKYVISEDLIWERREAAEDF